jgi:hypothetical protein
MNETALARLRDWTEPAHPAVIRLYDHLIQVYRIMRERQRDIDAAFDRVAAQIGFVVTTTLPVRVDITADGSVKDVLFDSDALRGTIFEKELSGFLKELTAQPFRGVPAGTYRFYLIWHDALKLKLRRDWLEPVHVLRALLDSLITQPAATALAESKLVRPEVREPAHWFDPGILIAIEDAIVISAIDEVYPELRLAERISADRLLIRRIRPEVMEPVHFRDLLGQLRGDIRSTLGK